MAKKRISSADLAWIVSQGLADLRSFSSRISVAIVPDEKDGWRALVDKQGRRYMTAVDEQRLEDIQRKLRPIYKLVS